MFLTNGVSVNGAGETNPVSFSVAYASGITAGLTCLLLLGGSAAAENLSDTAIQETVVVSGMQTGFSAKKNTPVIMDRVGHDDLRGVTGDGSIASDILVLPGVSAVEDADSPRYITIRGVAPDLNVTTLDGIVLATLGESGGGTRKVNLQLIPAELSSYTQVYKSFTAEQDSAAIGGQIDISSRSSADHNSGYHTADIYSIYSTFKGDNGSDAGGSYEPHWGYGIKTAHSERFGSSDQFGITFSGRFEKRVRNSAKRWQDTKYFFSDSGKMLDDSHDDSWNGYVFPSNHSYGSFTNQVWTAGGAGKLEWLPANRNLTASALLYYYRRWESSTMKKNDLYTKNIAVSQTPEGGVQQDNSIYSKWRYDHWDRSNRGAIGNVAWEDGRNRLTLRIGHTLETYNNNEPYIQARAYPTSTYITYQNGEDTGGLPGVISVTPGDITLTSSYKLNSAVYMTESARENLTEERLDYNWNTGPDDKGLGFATGFDARTMVIAKNVDKEEYKTGQAAGSFLYDPGYTPKGSAVRFPWINYNAFSKLVLPTLKPDTTQSAYDSAVSDYRYGEDVADGYISAHYATDFATVIAGLRYDRTNFVAHTPIVSSGAVSSSMSASPGGYEHFLPSVNFIVHPADELRFRFSYSETIGRPTPSDIAKAQNISCGDETAGGVDCTISRGNPDLKPRKSDNIDLGGEYYFDENAGVLAIGVFQKKIHDDIFTLTSQKEIDGTVYNVSQPMNASLAKLQGLEFQITGNKIQLLDNTFKTYFNTTYLIGQTNFVSDTGARRIGHLLYQPRVVVNIGGSVDIPLIHGGFSINSTYHTKYYTGFGSSSDGDAGYDARENINLALWHNLTDHIMLKYEVMSLLNAHPKFRMGDGLRYISEIDTYGNGIFVHLMVR